MTTNGHTYPEQNNNTTTVPKHKEHRKSIGALLDRALNRLNGRTRAHTTTAGDDVPNGVVSDVKRCVLITSCVGV
jgi:hypothetical protein